MTWIYRGFSKAFAKTFKIFAKTFESGHSKLEQTTYNAKSEDLETRMIDINGKTAERSFQLVWELLAPLRVIQKSPWVRGLVGDLPRRHTYKVILPILFFKKTLFCLFKQSIL